LKTNSVALWKKLSKKGPTHEKQNLYLALGAMVFALCASAEAQQPGKISPVVVLISACLPLK